MIQFGIDKDNNEVVVQISFDIKEIKENKKPEILSAFITAKFLLLTKATQEFFEEEIL